MAGINLETLIYVTEWAIRLLALCIVPARRSPAASAGWLLLLLFLPIPGILLFAAIGFPRFPPWRARRFETVKHYFTTVNQALARYAANATPEHELAQTLGGLCGAEGNEIGLIGDYEAAVAALVSDIDAARHHVFILVYIFASDAIGWRVADALRRAVARGVACRVMLDPIGSARWRRSSLAMLRGAGVEVREALPVHWLRARTRRDMRNHRKLFVIDDVIGYAGSQNLVARDFRRGIVNQELVVRVRGPAVAAISACIRGDWYLETEQPLVAPTIAPVAGSDVVQLLPSGADYPLEGFETLLVWYIHHAVRRVTLVTPYFIPDEDVLGAMRTACARGIEIRLILSRAVDQKIVNLAQSSYYDDLLRVGVQIYRYRDFLLHAKAVAIDGRLGIIGSSNVDLRSFQLNAEASLLLDGDASVADLDVILEQYLANSDRLSINEWCGRPGWRRILENIARIMSPIL